MNNLKVYFVTETFLPAHVGGTEMYLLNLCKHLQEKEIYCKVFCEGKVADYEEYIYENIPVQVCPSLDAQSIYKSLSTAKATEGFYVLHIHSFNGQINNNFLSELHKLRVPIFFTPHLVNNFCSNNNGSLKFMNKAECDGVITPVKCQACIFSNYQTLPFFYRTTFFHFIAHKLIPSNLARKLLSKYHFLAYEKLERIQLLNKQKVKVIALSEWYAELLMQNKIRDVILIQQGVGSHFLLKKPTSKTIVTKQGVEWIFIGRMSDEKGVKELVGAFLKICTPDDKLILVTIKPLTKEQYFEEVVQTVNTTQQISVFFNQSALEVAELLAAADCLILPSKITEMAPLVIQEAIASKKPVLVSEYIRDDVEEKGIGLKFSLAKKGDLAIKMKEMRATLTEGAYRSIDKVPLLAFEQVAEKHISVYLKQIKDQIIVIA